MPKEHRLTIRIDDADNAWLAEQEEELGIDKVSILCMMIRRHRKARLPAIQSAPVRHRGELIDPSLPRPLLAAGEITGWDYGDVAEEAEEYPTAPPPNVEPQEIIEDTEEAVDNLVASRLAAAKTEAAPVTVGYDNPPRMVQPLRHNRKPSGKGWMRA